MNRFILILSLFFSTHLFAEGLEQRTSVDLGLGLSPSFAPELGYKYSKLRTSVEIGVSFFEYNAAPFVEVKGISTPATRLKLLRIGIGVVNTKPVALFAPISVHLKDKVYLSPTFGFGEEPYTIFSIAYQLFP